MIEQSGFEEFRRDLERLMQALADFPDVAEGEIERGMDQALLLLAGDAADYPPAPSDSTYRRTGTLGRLWVGARPVVTRSSGAFVAGRIGNATPYGPYVQDPNRQAAQHRGRWRTTKDVVRDNEAGIKIILEQVGAELVTQIAEAAG